MKINNYYFHRVNDIESLKKIPQNCGIEIDLRYKGSDIILHHDPFKNGVTFYDFLSEYKHNGIILNCKSEGIESEILRILNQYKIKNFFFLDLTIPFLVKTSLQGCNKIAVRFSEYEPLCFVKKYVNICEWVWIDSFEGEYFDYKTIKNLSKNFKICLMSPELRGFKLSIIQKLKKRYKDIQFDAVCTKSPSLWI